MRVAHSEREFKKTEGKRLQISKCRVRPRTEANAAHAADLEEEIHPPITPILADREKAMNDELWDGTALGWIQALRRGKMTG